METDLVETMIEDPVRYHKEEPCFESVVHSFCHSHGKVKLVIDYAWDYEIRPRGESEFRLLQYGDVSDFRQVEAGSRFHQAFVSFYQDTGANGTIVVTHEVIRRHSHGYSATLFLSNLGAFSFDFKELSLEKRLGFSKAIAGKIDHFCDEKGEKFDFFYPFGDVCGSLASGEWIG